MQLKPRHIFLLALADFFLLLAILYRYEWRAADKVPIRQYESISDSGFSAKAEPMPEVEGVELIRTEKLVTGRGVKSVFFDGAGERLYSVNLEAGSVYEFDREGKRQSRYWKFDQTPAKGYDYTKRKWVSGSFAEKPVEGCLSHNGKYLWASWHNAGGVVAWRTDGDTVGLSTATHKATLADGQVSKRVPLTFFETGETPKVLLPDPGGKWLFVANWHSNTVSCIDISGYKPSSWSVRKHIRVGAVPRGMCFDGQGNLLVAGMASGSITRIGLDKLEVIDEIEVAPTPRHLLRDKDRIYVSFSSPEKLLAFSSESLLQEQEARTADDPRTIAISADGRLLFAVCYAANQLQVFRCSDLKLLGSWKCEGGPVGIDLHQSGNTVEAWVGNYKYATLKVFSILLVEDKGTAS